ncbi:MAG: cytidine deaminase, partial [Candidatus Marinimicrobia bacterium]|nr:cytidine deaminase [Candidatus Neomarinimicrobiota bacterium]
TTMCAERIAIYNAISAGEESLQALAIVTKDGGTPCGACRQVIYEQCGDIPVYLASENGSEVVEYRSTQLLPFPFNLNEH